MDTILVLDVGNTNITVGIYEGNRLNHHWRTTTVRDRTADEMGIFIKGLFRDKGFHEKNLDGIVVSSVVPPIMTAIEEMCQSYFHHSPLIVGPGIKTGLSIKYENPRDVGADRIANAVAAIQTFGPPLIVVDFGTATTFCVIDEKSQYLGGVIAPGIKIATEALFQNAAKLPRIELVRPKSVVGRNTITSMQSGVIFGFVGQVDGIVERIRQEISLPFQVVATGGLASLVSADSKTIQHTSPYLTLDGLRILWERNR